MSTFTVLSLVYISLINLLYGQPINTYINSITIITSLLRTSKVYSLSSDCNDGSCTALSTAEKQAILDIHNELRDRTAGGGLPGHPAATDMNYLIWDDGLANVAQTYAESCPGLNHNGNRGIEYLSERDSGVGTKWGPDSQYMSSFCSNQNCIYTGENLAVSSGPYTIGSITSQIETGWWDEYQYWTFGIHNAAGSCQSGKQCGHYTQLAWANTRYIGCGYTNGCGSGWASIFVCNYFPAGNFNSVPPYTSGTACSNCMSDRTVCQSNYDSRSNTAGSYTSQPYNKLCDGGACPTMCDGASYNRNTCDGTGCTPSTIDCNDGTISKTAGRNICGTPSPTAGTSNPTTGTPTTSIPTAATPSPTATTSIPTNSPLSIPMCLRMSNFDVTGGVSADLNGDYTYAGDNGNPYYTNDDSGTTYYIQHNPSLNSGSGGVWTIHDDAFNTFSPDGICFDASLDNCLGTGNWATKPVSGTTYSYDGNSNLVYCPPSPHPTQSPNALPTKTPITSTPTTSSPTTSNPTTSAPTQTPTTSIPTTTAPTATNTSPPTTVSPTTSLPTTSNPTTVSPTTTMPTTSQPTTSDPTTATPTATPITAIPTTSNPTTNDPTTSTPTATPITAQPTTFTPTTQNPTTFSPTTTAPTTFYPTTSIPTTSVPTTYSPTTTNPTTYSPTTSFP
eukprot:390393_1